MRSAVIILSVVAAVVAEAPYPAAHSFHRPSAPFPQFPQSRPVPQPFIPQPSYIPNNGYYYQQPSFGPPGHFPYPKPQPQLFPQPQPNPYYIYNFPQAPLAPQPAPFFPGPQGFVNQQLNAPADEYGPPAPLKLQPLTNNGVSSYQTDANQYATSQAQIHGEVLDQTVVSRLQDIIKDSEHTSAKNAGYLSLVSGVSLESAKPSIEISSFVHNSPQNDAELINIRSSPSSASSSSSSSGISAGGSQSHGSSASFGFLPNSKLINSYGVPN